MRRIAILAVLSVLLFGCASSARFYKPSPTATMKSKLEGRGVTVVVLGDQILMVMPSALIFKPYTSTIMPTAYSTLDVVSDYINLYDKMLVNIAAYTNQSDSESTDLALSKEQAKSVEKYLLSTGIEARLLHAGGYGGTHLVSKNSLDWRFNLNYRIEITLEKLYV